MNKLELYFLRVIINKDIDVSKPFNAISLVFDNIVLNLEIRLVEQLDGVLDLEVQADMYNNFYESVELSDLFQYELVSYFSMRLNNIESYFNYKDSLLNYLRECNVSLNKSK